MSFKLYVDVEILVIFHVIYYGPAFTVISMAMLVDKKP